MSPGDRGPKPPGWLLAAAALGLFVVWSNSFVANEYLLTGSVRRFDWLGLTVGRSLMAAALCWAYCLGWRRRETLELLRAYPLRLASCAALALPLYNFCLSYGQQQGMPAPVASVVTTLAPLFIMVLATVFLGERPPAALWIGLVVAAVGMWVIGGAERDGATGGYSWAVVIAAGAPLCWSTYSVISKPMTDRVSALLWTYLSVALGGLMVLPLAFGRAGHQIASLDGPGWTALAYLAWPCTVIGFAVWTGLLRYLPATVVGLTVFLNPPLATLSKALLSNAWPETFVFAVTAREWVGGAVVLSGLAIGLSRRLGLGRGWQNELRS